jgi:hypothetical protein
MSCMRIPAGVYAKPNDAGKIEKEIYRRVGL